MRNLRLFIVEVLRVFILRRTLKEIAAFTALGMASVAASLAATGFLSFIDTGPELFQENGPIETVQAAIVGVAGILFYLAAIRFAFEIFYGTLLLALASFIATIREIPGCESNFYDGGPCLPHADLPAIRVAIILAVAALILIRRVPLARHVRELNFFWVVPAGAAFAILIVAEIMEDLGQPRFEETLELAGYLHLFVFAVTLHLAPHWFDVRRAPKLVGPGIWRRRDRFVPSAEKSWR